MKTRLGFVSNSSSASFVIAIRNDCTLENFREYYSEEIKSFIEEGDVLNYVSTDYLDPLWEFLTIEEKVKFISQVLFTAFKYDRYGSVSIDNWTALGKNVSNESDNLIDLFLYSYGGIDEEKLKIASCS
jgi:hypothetical protein